MKYAEIPADTGQVSGLLIIPYDAMMDRKVWTKLDYSQRELTIEKQKVNERDKEYKMKIKHNAENKNTRFHNLTIGDYVLLKQNKVNKWTTPCEATYYTVYKIRGSTVWARRVTDGCEVCRDSTCFKYIDRQRISREVNGGIGNRLKPDNWREITLRKAKVGKLFTREQNNQTAIEPTRNNEHECVLETVPRRSERIRHRPDHNGDFIYY